MSWKQLFYSLVVLDVSLQAGWTQSLRNCNCSVYAKRFCRNGDCYMEDNCKNFGCRCWEGWTGDRCNVECNRNCNGGSCIFENDKPQCLCPYGFTSISNCTIRDAMPLSKVKSPTDKRWLILFAVIPLSILFFSALLFHQLWRSRVLFAMRIVHYFHWQSPDEEKEFDAFVSFRSCTNDEDWVLNNLFPKLEEEMGFRLCIHLRDFPAGELISNNIIDAIEKSRRTILVISPDYVSSEWTRMEYQVAQQEMLKLRHKIIPIIFRDVSDTDHIDKCLSYILQTVTYLKWPGDTDPKSQRRFWEQLKLTMPKIVIPNETTKA